MLASAGGEIKYWDVSSYSKVKELFNSKETAKNISWSKDGQYIASVNNELQEVVVQAVSGPSSSRAFLFRTPEIPKCLQFVNVSPRYLAVADTSKSILIWDLKSQNKKKSFLVPDGDIVKISLSLNDSYIATGTSHGSSSFFSNINNTMTGPIQLFNNKSQVMDLKYSAINRHFIGACSQKGDVVLVDSNANKVVKLYKEMHSAPATCLAFSPINDLLFISVGYDKRINCYNTNQKQHLSSHRADDPLTSACFMADGKYVALGTITGAILIHDLRMLVKAVCTVKAYDEPITDLKLQPKRQGSRKTTEKKSTKVVSFSCNEKENSPLPATPKNRLSDFNVLSPVKNTNNSILQDKLENSLINPKTDGCPVSKQMNCQTDKNFELDGILSPVGKVTQPEKEKASITHQNDDLATILSPMNEDLDDTLVDLVNFSKLTVQKNTATSETESNDNHEPPNHLEPTLPEVHVDKEKKDNFETIEEMRCLLQDYQTQTGYRLNHMTFVMIKYFLDLKKEMKALFSDHNSINEDLVIENRRLREEIEYLRNNF